jgi:hypothetical protein
MASALTISIAVPAADSTTNAAGFTAFGNVSTAANLSVAVVAVLRGELGKPQATNANVFPATVSHAPGSPTWSATFPTLPTGVVLIMHAVASIPGTDTTIASVFFSCN